jgi:hypothetical protein
MNEMFLSPGFSFWALGGYSFVMVFINGVALYYSYAIVSTLQSIKEFDFRPGSAAVTKSGVSRSEWNLAPQRAIVP